MELRSVDFREDPEIKEKIKKLYLQAFPKEERLPWQLLCANSRRQGIDLRAWLEGDTFCGMTSSVTVDGLHFLLFFAVEESLRGKGYGSRILGQVKREHGNVILNVEPLVETAPNLAQRKQRFAFYEKNGFYDTGWHVWEVGGKFRVLSTGGTMDVAAYRKIFRKLTFGIWRVRLRRAEDT